MGHLTLTVHIPLLFALFVDYPRVFSASGLGEQCSNSHHRENLQYSEDNAKPNFDKDCDLNCKDQQNCQKQSKQVEAAAKSNMALVLYDESAISPFHIKKRSFQFGDKLVEISQDWESVGVAAVVWEAAVVMGEYLLENRQLLEEGSVLELGAGTGLAGIVAALLGAQVTITDREVALDIIRQNVKLNEQKFNNLDNVKVQELEWGKNHGEYKPYSLVIGADIIYIEETFQDLLDTFLHVCNKETVVLISCKIRYARDSRFLSMMEEYFDVKHVHFDQKKDVHIYQCNKR